MYKRRSWEFRTLIGTAIGLAGIFVWHQNTAPQLGPATTASPESVAIGKLVQEPAVIGSQKVTQAPSTKAELRQIDALIAEAKNALRSLELQNAIPKKAAVVGDEQFDGVLVPPLTVEQLQPVYDILSANSRKFDSASASGRAFRKRADTLLRTLQQRPSKYVERSINRKTGEIFYKVISMSERADLTLAEDGVIHIDGPNQVKLGKGDEAQHLFPSDPPR